MKHTIRIAFLSLLFSSVAFGQQPPETRTFPIDCWSGGHCAMPCGGGATGNYDCSDGTGGWTSACAFTDPLPQGAQVTKVEAVIYTHQCAGSSSLTATLNGQTIGSVTEGRASCQCLSSPCLDTRVASVSMPDGFPGYVSGGSNTFGIAVTSGVVCVEHVEITLTYTSGTVTITNEPPTIPRGNLVNNCVTYNADLRGHAVAAGQPERGIEVRFRSDRGAADTIRQQQVVTNNNGDVTGEVETRRQGIANINADTNPQRRVVPAAINFLEADWEPNFRITAYIIASEADFGGRTVTNPCGLTGTYSWDFLYSNRGVLMQGTGQANNGTLVTIDWNRSGRPLNRNNVCFTTTPCARTASGACAQAGVTVAVDPTIIPMGANINITGVGGRTAQDTGGRITGYHIDNFAGFGQAAVANWNNLNTTVRYLGGGPGQCN